MNAAQETYETWNKVAGLYEEKFMHLDLYDQSYKLFCQFIRQEDATVLEIGCGPGNICQYLLKQRPDLKILGTDFAPNMIALAEKNNPQAEFKILDAREIKTLDRQFNVIISGFCLPYLSPEAVKTLIEDMKSMLLPKGVIYLSFVPGDPAQSGMMTSSSGDRVYFYYHPQQEILDLLTENGFKILTQQEIDYTRPTGNETHCVLIAAL